MEMELERQHQQGTTLYSDKSYEIRMASRPTQSRGKGFEDMGSDFSRPKKDASVSCSKTMCGRDGTQLKSRAIQSISRVSYDSFSDDDLGLLSAPPSSQNAHNPAKKPARQSKLQAANHNDDDERAYIDSKGRRHAYMPGFPPDKKLPSFKKKKKSNCDPGPSSQHSESSVTSTKATAGKATTRPTALRSQSTSPASTSPPALREAQKALETHTDHVARDAKGKKKAISLNELTSNRGSRQSSEHLESGNDDDPKTPSPSATQRPRPRPAYNASRAKAASQEDVASQKPDDVSNKGKGRAGGSKKHVEAFPLMPPLEDDSSVSKTSKGKNKQVNPITALSPVRQPDELSQSSQPNPVQALSPLSSSLVESKSGLFSRLYTDRSPSRHAQQTSKRRKAMITPSPSSAGDTESESAHEDNSPLKASSVRPFPMQTQLYGETQSFGKRLSQELSSVDSASRGHKKRRPDADELLDEILRSSEVSDLEDDDDDPLFLDPNIDPKTLCPWCDEKLPQVPTPHLLHLIAIGSEASCSDVRPTNPLGLSAPLEAYIGACQRHRFESHQVPLAQQRGWPIQIDWDNLGARVRALKWHLQEIVDDVDEDFLPCAQRMELGEDSESDSDGERWVDRPRKQCVFWKDVVKRVRKNGSRQATGIAGQFSNFDKTQPGYYGEQGYVIIHQTIYNLFPPSSYDADSTLPLTPTDFNELVLMPEAALLLIMEDMEQTRGEALKTLRESTEYGVAMFPDEHADGAVGAGDQIIIERARRRRKELEEEERMEREEEDYWAAIDSEEPRKEKSCSRPRATQKTKYNTEDGDSEFVGAASRKRHAQYRQNGQQKKSGTKSKASRNKAESDVMMLTDSTDASRASSSRTRPSTHRGPQTRSRTASAAPSSDADIRSGGYKSLPAQPVSSRPRPRPKLRQDAPVSDAADTGRSDADSQSRWRSAGQDTDEDILFSTHDRQETEADATPKANRLSQASSFMAASAGSEREALKPLERARRKYATKTAESKENESRTPRNLTADSSPQGKPSNRVMKFAGRGTTPDDFKWLLSSP